MKLSSEVSPGIIITGVIGLVLATAIYFMSSGFQSRTTLYLGDGIFDVTLAFDQESRDLGLAGVEELKPNEGLLMAFPTNDKWSIWMKDMLIPLDIIWLDDSKRVVYIVEDADPDGGEQALFTPTKKAKYVVELGAGTVRTQNIKIGRSAIFSVTRKEVQ